MTHGKELIEELKAELLARAERYANRESRIDGGQTSDSDCATSARMDSINDSIAKTKLEILVNKGLAEFDVLLSNDGDIVSNKLINGQYGQCWVIDEPFRDVYGKFVGEPKREATLIKKGLKWGVALLPAWVSVQANGEGMYGAYNSRAVIFQSKINYYTGK